MADKVVQLKNKDGDKLYPVSVLPGERILWEDSMEPAPSMENVEDMTGATASAAGKHGLVPKPEAGDQNKFLRGDGTWGNIFDIITVECSISLSTSSGPTDIGGNVDISSSIPTGCTPLAVVGHKGIVGSGWTWFCFNKSYIDSGKWYYGGRYYAAAAGEYSGKIIVLCKKTS